MNRHECKPKPAESVVLPAPEGYPEVSVSREAAAAIRSLGWELNRLAKASVLLSARLKKGSLPTSLLDFLSGALPAISGDEPQGAFRTEFTQCILIREGLVKIPWDALGENGVSAKHLALFHLPALRGFWARALRRSHHERLCRELPRAWFVTADPPPVGAVVPGLGITSWERLSVDGSFVRVQLPTGKIVIEVAPVPEDVIQITAHYERVDGRVVLRSAA